MIFILKGSSCLSLFSIQIILAHLFDICSECFFQFKCVSKVSPRKLNSLTFSIMILLILGAGASICLLCMWKTMNLDLVMFSESLFITSHSFILKSSLFINKLLSAFCAFTKLLNELKSVVSSAYDIKLNT